MRKSAKMPAPGNPAQQKPHSVPSNPDAATVAKLWEDFELTARKLFDLSVSAPETVDFVQLHSVITWLLATLRKNSKGGGCKAEEAIMTLHRIARIGTVFLEQASKDEESRETLKALAAKNPDWPVLLSPQDSSHEAAKKYLHEVGVGTASIPPTAKTRISTDDPWTQLAVMLIDKIRAVRSLLAHQVRTALFEKEHPEAMGKPPILPLNPQFPELENEAHEWKHVLDLPPNLNKETRAKWWAVAKEMLKDYLETNPSEAARHFKQVKTTADDEAKSLQTIVIRSVREAFYAIVTRTNPATG